MDSLAEAINYYQDKGYTYDFNLIEDGIESKSLQKHFNIDEFQVEKVHRFEGQSSTGDSSILYVINTNSSLKGLLVDAYGTYAGQVNPEVLKKLQMAYQH